MSNFGNTIVVTGVGATGLSPGMRDRVTEVAALRIVDGRVVERYVSLINCNVRIPSFITELTGITQAMVNGAPSCNSVIPELLRFIVTDALSAHNASFDENTLLAERLRQGLTPATQDLICSLKFSTRNFPGTPRSKLSLM